MAEFCLDTAVQVRCYTAAHLTSVDRPVVLLALRRVQHVGDAELAEVEPVVGGRPGPTECTAGHNLGEENNQGC